MSWVLGTAVVCLQQHCYCFAVVAVCLSYVCTIVFLLKVVSLFPNEKQKKKKKKTKKNVEGKKNKRNRRRMKKKTEKGETVGK